MSTGERRLSRREIQTLLGVDETFLIELERESIITMDPEGDYSGESIERARIGLALHRDLGVNVAGIAVALHLLDTIEAERHQFREILDWLKSRAQQL